MLSIVTRFNVVILYQGLELYCIMILSLATLYESSFALSSFKVLVYCTKFQSFNMLYQFSEFHYIVLRFRVMLYCMKFQFCYIVSRFRVVLHCIKDQFCYNVSRFRDFFYIVSHLLISFVTMYQGSEVFIYCITFCYIVSRFRVLLYCIKVSMYKV